MGVESSVVLARWCFEAAVRPCSLDELIVITAQTGDEYADTGRDVEAHILPLMRAHSIRFVQVARAGHHEADGIIVLDDTSRPTRVHLCGAYKLSDELRRNGTVPQYAGQHRCSLKFKAWVIETWLDANVRPGRTRHAFGYNSDETARVERCNAAIRERIAFGFNADEGERVARSMTYNTVQRTAFYPLVEWGWNRARCEQYLRDAFGIGWKKSACVYCPFTPLRGAALERHREHPDAVAEALMLEHLSLALNPRATLYRDRSLIQITRDDGNQKALDQYESRLASLPWAIYRVRRIYAGPGKADRAVERQAVYASHAAATAALRQSAAGGKAELTELRGMLYAYIERRSAAVFPCREEYFVAAPAIVDDKARHGLAHFEVKWRSLQMRLWTDGQALSA
jgi:hypothetical protein